MQNERTCKILSDPDTICAKISPVILGAGSKDKDAGHLYCSTANPLGVVYIDMKTGRGQRLFRDPVYMLSGGPRSWVAALRYGGRIEIFKGGKLVRLLKLRHADNSLIGWTGNALLYRSENRIYALDVARGGTKPLGFLNNLVYANPAGSGWVAVSQSGRKMDVDLYSGNKIRPAYSWSMKSTGRFWNSTVVGNRYLAVWVREHDSNGNYLKDRLLLFDLIDRRQWEMPSRPCEGISRGRSSAELLVAYTQTSPPWEAAKIIVEAIHLPDLSTKKLVSVNVVGADLGGVTADGKWLVMYAAYPDSGPGHPGKVFAVRLKDGYRRVVRENVYDYVLTR